MHNKISKLDHVNRIHRARRALTVIINKFHIERVEDK